jgi:DNA-binding transcriptional LysR family regulator
LKRYHYFRVLADELHFARAAERLGISQPALSQQIRLLELSVGAELLSRSQRRIKLTEVGVVLLEHTSRLLDQAEAVRILVKDAADGKTGRVSITYVASAALSGVLPDIMYMFRRERPNVHVVVREMDMLEQVASVASGSVDIGIIRPPVPDMPSNVAQIDLLEEPMVAALRTTHQCADHAEIRLSDLRDDVFVLTHTKDGVGLFDITMALCHDAGFHPKTEVISPQTSIVISMVAAGLGVALVPLSSTKLAPANVVFIPLQENRRQSKLTLIHIANRFSPVAQTFIETAISWTRDHQVSFT